ncbi:MAG: hypothetical protein LUG47_00485 [Clostridiales bacterium]|nr:hypothetical protein [Clostridiales bacterium]
MDYKMKNKAMPKTDKTPGERYHEMPEDLLNLIMRMRTAQMVCELLHRYPEESEPEGDDKKIVMVLRPGRESKVLTSAEACELMPSFYERYDCIEDFAGSDLILYYRTDQVLKLDGRVFLLGAAVVCRENEDCDLLSLTGDDIYRTFCYASDNEAILCGDGKEFPAMLLE